jgi:pimeloyl-ACP methyl ester carboxylesterase
VLDRISGPVVVGAHAYAGAVISAIANLRAQGLVFIASLTPDEGETVADLFYRGAQHARAPKLGPDMHGLIWMPEPSFTSAFAQGAAPEEAALLAATQRPISVACIQEKSPTPLWKRKPAWYLVATQDRMIDPDIQRFMATRMAAHTRIEDVDHTPIVTNSEIVIEVFAAAIDGTVKS